MIRPLWRNNSMDDFRAKQTIRRSLQENIKGSPGLSVIARLTLSEWHMLKR
jgi:hypothetical protein